VALCERHDFTLESAFAAFAENSMSRLGTNELCQGFERLGVTCDSSDARLIISRFDGDEDMRLSFWEFANMVLPIESTLRDDMERR
jgi:Ca2+-binding EF-hand superfamily protein